MSEDTSDEEWILVLGPGPSQEIQPKLDIWKRSQAPLEDHDVRIDRIRTADGDWLRVLLRRGARSFGQ